MKFFILLLAVVQLLKNVEGKPAADGCTLDVNVDLPKKNDPIFMRAGPDKVYRLLIPKYHGGKTSSIHVKNGESLMIACTGDKNHFNRTKSDKERAVCNSGVEFKVDGQVLSAQNLECKSKAQSSIVNKEKTCAQGKGTILEIGFKVDSWYPLVTVCHNMDEGLTYYSSHKLFGQAIKGKVFREIGRPPFSRGEKWLFEGYNVDNAYKIQSQHDFLKNELGSSTNYIDEKARVFMARGHLAPDADFIYSAWQMSTYYYINAAPQWQSINAGNWLHVETITRNIAAALDAELEITTGTHGVMNLKNSKGIEENVYLEKNQRVPVPAYYWKIIRNPEDQSCIAFVSTNNPHLTSAPEPICKDVCAKNRWPNIDNTIKKGIVLCCEYKDLKKAVVDVPDMECKKPLVYTK